MPVYKTFPYQGPKPFASTTMSGGGKYVALAAGEGFTYCDTFKAGGKTASASGAAPRMVATAKVPAGFGKGTATIVLKAETGPRTHEHGQPHARHAAEAEEEKAVRRGESPERGAGGTGEVPEGKSSAADLGLDQGSSSSEGAA